MICKRVLCCLATALALSPEVVHAQGRRGGMVVTPFGPLYNTRSPEWRMSGGDIFLYQQIMEQKMLMRRQQLLLKQQQMLLRQQQKGKPQPGSSIARNQDKGLRNEDRVERSVARGRRKSPRVPSTGSALAAERRNLTTRDASAMSGTPSSPSPCLV
jgi:hypothetical protein